VENDVADFGHSCPRSTQFSGGDVGDSMCALLLRRARYRCFDYLFHDGGPLVLIATKHSALLTSGDDSKPEFEIIPPPWA
ncbi:hypothetical protein, partial [Mesorhizobium sp.]|uniref:hypothetical protein n=1 Tax=Mesorhizobium sp. TaxID=1871066 RepID=UPI00257A9C20